MCSGQVLLKLFFAVIVNVFMASSMAFLFACFIKSTSAWNVLKVPMYHGTAMMRELLTEAELAWFSAPDEVKEGLKEYMGIIIKNGDKDMEKVIQVELFGFLGVNGAGKSTTINMLFNADLIYPYYYRFKQQDLGG